MQPASTPTETISQNWAGLTPGQHITVAEPTGHRYPATVDMITEDHNVVWVHTTPHHQRKAFDRREGIIITPV